MFRDGLFILALLVSVLAPGAGIAQESHADWAAKAQAVMAHPKITDSLKALEAFQDGGGSGKFIVNIARPIGVAEADGPLRSDNQKVARRNAVAAARSQALAAMPELPAGVVRHRYDNVFAFSVEVTPEQLELLLANPLVESVDPVFTVEAQLAQGIPLMHADTFRSQYSGQGLSVAICDTGIDYNNVYLGGGGFPNAKVIGGDDVGQNDGDPMDANGHGTACAGIVAGTAPQMASGDYIGGVAPNAKLYALKITWETGGGEAHTDAMIAAWDWCVTHQNDDPTAPIMIISTSFGGGKLTDVCDDAVPSMTNVASAARNAGMTLFVSSGNDGYCDAVGWPSCISYVNAVGAVYDAGFGTIGFCLGPDSCADKVYDGWCSDDTLMAWDGSAADRVTSYSNSGPQVALYAPSNMAYTLGIPSMGEYPYHDGFGGTSAACPYAAGAAAALQSAAKSLTGSWLIPAQVELALEQSGDSVSDPKNGLTRPRVNLAAAIQSLGGLHTASAHIAIQHTYRGDLVVRLGVGPRQNPLWSTVVSDREGGYAHDLTADVDLTEALAYLPPCVADVWFLEVSDESPDDIGTITEFTITYDGKTYAAHRLPVAIEDFSTSYATIGDCTLLPYPLLLN